MANQPNQYPIEYMFVSKNSALPAQYEDTVILGISTMGVIVDLTRAVYPITFEVMFLDKHYTWTYSKAPSKFNNKPVIYTSIALDNFVASDDTVHFEFRITDSNPYFERHVLDVDVFTYKEPSVTLGYSRCNEDGTPNNAGDYCKVSYSYDIYPLGNRNSIRATLDYKGSDGTSGTYPLPNDSYSVDSFMILPMSAEHTFWIALVVSDDFSDVSKDGQLSIGYTLLDFNESGKGMAIGRVSSKANALEIAMKTYHTEAVDIDTTALSGINVPVNIHSGHRYPYIRMESNATSTDGQFCRFGLDTNADGEAGVFMSADDDSTHSSRVQVYSASARSSLDNALMLREYDGSSWTNYPVYHSGAKPPISITEIWNNSGYWETSEGNFGVGSWGGYSAYIFVGIANNYYITTVIPAAHILTSNRNFSMSDDVGHLRFYLKHDTNRLYITGVDRTSSSYSFRYLYGIK